MTDADRPAADPAAATYLGGAFAPHLESGRITGPLTLGRGAVRLHAGEQSVSLPLAGLRLRLGGAGDRIIFFEHPEHPETSLYTSDRTVLEHPALAAEPAFAEQIGAVRKKRRRVWTSALGVVAALVLLVVGLVAAKDPLIGLVVARVPPALEVRLGELVFSQVKTQSRLLDDPELDRRIEALAAPLLAAQPAPPPYDFDFHVVDDPAVNAFAVPGGHVVVHTGLILAAEDAAEVQGVLAHEIAHVTQRHSLRQMVGTAGVYVLVQTVLGDASGLVAVIADGGTRLLTLGYSREHELEADEVGWDTLVRAGIDPRGLVDFFDTLREEQGVAGEIPAFLSTHPATEERIERLRERLAERDWDMTPNSGTDVDFGEFQRMIRSIPSGSNVNEAESAAGGEPTSAGGY